MNFLIEFATLSYLLKHGVAKRLKRLFPESKFTGFISSHINVDIRGYLSRQGDVKYEFLYDGNELFPIFLKQEIDYDELRRFEASTPEKSLWRFVAMDTAWGHQFVKTAYFKRRYLHTISNDENILKMLYGYLKFYEEMLTKFDIDVVLPATGINSLGCSVLEQVCKNMGIHYLMVPPLETLNYVGITPNRRHTFPHINKTYKELMEGKIKLDLSKGEETYQELIRSLHNDTYFNKSRITHLNKSMPATRFLVNIPKIIISETIRWSKRNIAYKRLFRKKRISSREARITLLSSISYAIGMRRQVVRLFDEKFYSRFDANQKYIYLPLHITPEYSTQVRAPMWVNQLVVVEALAKSIPVGWRLYVKEHPATLLSRVRLPSFYREIKSYSNVDLIPTYIDNNEVIKNAQLVVNTAGTSTGWEAIQFGKPVIDFAESRYDIMGLTRRCTDLEKLSIVIDDEIKRIRQISPEERKKRIIYFLTAVNKHAFWADNPFQAIGDAQCNDEEAEALGRLIGDKIKEYLDEHPKEKVNLCELQKR